VPALGRTAEHGASAAAAGRGAAAEIQWVTLGVGCWWVSAACIDACHSRAVGS
jgi:hypothetical protein